MQNSENSEWGMEILSQREFKSQFTINRLRYDIKFSNIQDLDRSVLGEEDVLIICKNVLRTYVIESLYFC